MSTEILTPRRRRKESETPMTMPAVTQETKSAIETFGRGRFSPGTYMLDLSQVSECPVELNGERLTFSQALNRLLQEKASASSPWGGLEFKTEHNKYVLTVPEGKYYHGLASGFRKLLELSGNGVNPYEATWFPFDSDFSGPINFSHSFFVVSGGKIADQHCHFADWDPLILKKYEDVLDLQSHRGWEIYWYRKFYAETITGQVCVLRPDKPILYHFERPHEAEAIRVVTIRKIYYLLWAIALFLAAMAFPLVRPHLAIAAGAMLGATLLFAWKTRRVGREL